MRKPNKYYLETVCCKSAVYRQKVGTDYMTLCHLCHSPSKYLRVPVKSVKKSISIKKPSNQDVPIKQELPQEFPPYKPANTLSISQREDEAIKRRQIVHDYEGIKPSDPTEIKFIKQRIKWNNERIALLLG